MENMGTPAVWRRSTRCDSGTCVEVAWMPTGMAMRDAKDPDGGSLEFGAHAWREFLTGVRTGEFDR